MPSTSGFEGFQEQSKEPLSAFSDARLPRPSIRHIWAELDRQGHHLAEISRAFLPSQPSSSFPLFPMQPSPSLSFALLLLPLCCAPAARGLGGTGSWEGAQPGQLTRWDIPCPMESCSAQKLRGKLTGGRCLELAGHRLVGGEQLYCTALVLFSLLSLLLFFPFLSCPIKLSLSQPTVMV